MNIYEQIGKNIFETRKARGLTQEELAKLVGISQGYLNLIESGQRRATVATLEKFMRVLKISPNDLYHGWEKTE